MQPLSLREQISEQLFVPQEIYMVQIATPRYDACKKRGKNGSIVQVLADLPSVINDCDWLEDAISKYGKIRFGPDVDPYNDPENKTNIFKMTSGPSFATVAKTRT